MTAISVLSVKAYFLFCHLSLPISDDLYRRYTNWLYRCLPSFLYFSFLHYLVLRVGLSEGLFVLS